jgi:hypothetical protein
MNNSPEELLEGKSKAIMQRDRQNILRGKCTGCNQCISYQLPQLGNDCAHCRCKPIMHEEVETARGPTVSNISNNNNYSKRKVCKLHGCNKEVYKENGRSFDYCSKTHAEEDNKSRQGGHFRMTTNIK